MVVAFFFFFKQSVYVILLEIFDSGNFKKFLLRLCIRRSANFAYKTFPPKYRRNAIKPSKFKTSEELELEAIAQKKAETKKALALSRRSYQMSQEAMTYHPTRSSQEPTRPMEFKFKTDTRIKSHGMETRQDREAKDFVGALRKYGRSPVSIKKKK